MRNINRYMFLVVFATLWAGVFAAEPLGIYIDLHRYMAAEQKTVVHIDYQLPYRNMVFLAQNGGFFAELLISVNISKADSLIYSRDFVDNIGISNKFDATSQYKKYLNRLSYVLDEGTYQLKLKVLDKNSLREYTWQTDISAFTQDTAISDIELCSEVVPDSTAYLSMFKRGNMLYRTEPSLFFAKEETDYVHLYAELYSTPATRQDSYFLNLTIEQADSLVFELSQDLALQKDVQALNLKIPIAELNPGKYLGFLSVQAGEKTEQREFEFFVMEAPDNGRFLFADPDDEYNLMKYFGGSRLPSDWKSLSQSTKRRYISSFWDQLGGRYNKSSAAMIKEIGERVDYANKNFSHFNNGWTTDMGRIYIRNGAPDDVEKDESSDETRFVRKDYQIWKYRSNINAVYLFVDIQMNGNAKLLYVSGDEMEVSNPKWQYYLGEDFDTGKLSN